MKHAQQAINATNHISVDDPLILFRLHIVGLRDIVGLRVALVHMIGFEDMARVHMAPVHIAPVHSVRVALTHMVVAGMVAAVPVRR
jgi:hypothetical protein